MSFMPIEITDIDAKCEVFCIKIIIASSTQLICTATKLIVQLYS